MTYAAFYIQSEKQQQNLPNPAQSQSIKDKLQNAYKNAKNSLQNFDIKKMAQNINLQSATTFMQKYGVAALQHIINGVPVTNQTMLDSLFNGLAPALGMTAGQLGYNSLAQMINAVQSGNINVPQFMDGLSGALDIVRDSANGQADYSKYGEEIPIDLTQSFGENHQMETPDRRVQNGQTYNEYYHVLPLMLEITGLIKDDKNFTAHEFADRLNDVALSLKPFTFRAGKKIYENYVFTNFNPRRETENGITFDSEIKFIQGGDVEFVKVNIPKRPSTGANGQNGTSNAKSRTQKNNPLKGQNVANKTSSPKYQGAIGAWQWLSGGEDITNIPILNSVTGTLEKLKPQ